jgi:succinate-semialdehyde dehydrogenase/glutarate-semialdehyde dehydrogenase
MSLTLKNPNLLQTGLFIDNEFLSSPSQPTFPVHNPATGELICKVTSASVQDAQRAIKSADAALPAWRSLSGKERAQKLRKWFDLIVENADDLALLMTSEQGKPLAEAKGEVLYGASFVEWFAEEAKRVEGSVLASPQKDKQLLVFKEAVGVCVAITPWNFPIAMITRKTAPALAAGCTVIAKPAEQTPLCALALAVLARQAGIPAGVFNVLPSGEAASIEVGEVLCASPVVKKLSFTGSTEVGRILMRQCAPTVKRLSLELGGHAPFIVFEDADLAAAVEGAVLSKYRNSGQTCVCTNRFYVHRSVATAFAEALAHKVAGMKVGNGTTPGIEQGPLINEQAVEKVERHIADAQAKGATVLAGGKRHPLGGTFFEPTVIANADETMQIAQEETFGPVAPIFTFDDEKAVITQANHPEYGLAAYFYSKDISQVFRVAKALEFGMIGVNTGIISNEVAPFGGVKQSGLGREGSRWGIEEYLETKYLCLGGMQD